MDKKIHQKNDEKKCENFLKGKMCFDYSYN